MLAPLDALDTAEEGQYIRPSHFAQDEFERVGIRHEASGAGKGRVDDSEKLHRSVNLVVSQHRDSNIAQVVNKQRQAVVALIPEIAPGLLERAQDLFGPRVRPAVDHVLPGRVRDAVTRLAHARTL